MSLMRLSIVRGRNRHILAPRNYGAFVWWIIKQDVGTTHKGLLYKYSVSKWFSMFSNELRDIVSTFGCSIRAINHFLETTALLFVARYHLFQWFDLLSIVRRIFSCFVSKCRFVLDVRQTTFWQQRTHAARSSRETKPKSGAQDLW